MTDVDKLGVNHVVLASIILSVIPAVRGRRLGAGPPGGGLVHSFASLWLAEVSRSTEVLIRAGSLSPMAFLVSSRADSISEGYGSILGPLGCGWGQIAHQWAIASAGVVMTWIHTFSSNLINEATWRINRSYAVIKPTDSLVSSPSRTGAKVYADSQCPLKDFTGNAVTLLNLFGQTPQNILPAILFGGFPFGFLRNRNRLPINPAAP